MLVANKNYIKLIQDNSFATEKELEKYLEDYFVLDKPKHELSGDFYYVKQRGEELVLAVEDCTGSGISSALLATLAYDILDSCVQKEVQ
jgi:serine phosphatase RsbU (regulator of sigma subunit)